MAFSYTLKDWKQLSEDTVSLGAEFVQLVKMVGSLLRQGANLSKELLNLGWEIMELAQDMLRSTNTKQLGTLVRNLMQQFIFQTKK